MACEEFVGEDFSPPPKVGQSEHFSSPFDAEKLAVYLGTCAGREKRREEKRREEKSRVE